MKRWFYDNKGKVIYPFFSFKFFFFVFIFVHHIYSKVKIPVLRQPSLAVSAFIIISGFLTGYSYIDKKLNIKESFQFAFKRIKKLYPLHLLMTFACLTKAGVFNAKTFSALFEFFKQLLCNIFLIESWINDSNYYFAYNGVAWFLSVYLFLMILTIPIMIGLKKLVKKRKSMLLLILISLLVFGGSLLYVYLIRINKLPEEYYLYIFPPARIFEYIIGIIFGIISKKLKIKFKMDKHVFTGLEVVSIGILVFFILNSSNILEISSLLSGRLNLWIIPVIFLLVVFSYQKGYISKALSFKPLVYLGEISMYAFLIHQPLIYYISEAFLFVHYRFLAFHVLVLTLLLSHLINKWYVYKNSQV